jgi:hypothetical protein
VTNIKPPGGPRSPAGTSGINSPEAPEAGSSFREVVGTGAATPAAPGAPASPSQAVIADLQAARITPDEAVRKLTALAVDGSRCTPAMRPGVERRIRQMLASDPVVGELLRQMGAAVPREPE